MGVRIYRAISRFTSEVLVWFGGSSFMFLALFVSDVSAIFSSVFICP